MRRLLENLFLSIYCQQNTTLVRSIAFLVVLTVIGFYFFIVEHFTVNIPFQDDFAFLFFSNKLLEAESFQQKFYLFLNFHNEHRIAFPRLIIYLLLKQFSMVNFKTAIFFGNAFLIGLLAVIYKLNSKGQSKHLVLVICSFLLFQLQHWENSSWALAGLSNFCGVFFAGIAFYYLNRSDWIGFIFSFVFAVLALSANGGGLLVFFTIGLFYILTKNIKFFIPWFIVSSVIVTLYFIGYVKPENHPGIFEALQHPLRFTLYFISFLGGSFSADNHYLAPLAPMGGITALMFFGYLTWKKYYLNNPGVYCFLLFILFVAASAAVTRSGFGLHQAFSSRYKIFSTVYLILSFLAVMNLFYEEKKEIKAKIIGYFAIFALVFNLSSFPRNLYLLEVHTKKTVFHMRNWVMKNEGVNIDAKNIDDPIMTKSLKNRVYQFSCAEVPIRKQDQAKWCE